MYMYAQYLSRSAAIEWIVHHLILAQDIFHVASSAGKADRVFLMGLKDDFMPPYELDFWPMIRVRGLL